MKLNTNFPALAAFNFLNATDKKFQKTINALSTGLRINSAADDAAGLAISEKMRSQISGLDVAARNTQDGLSLLQTAEGALNETTSMLQRMRELSVQAANDTLTANDRQYIQLEIDEIKKEINRIADTTQFNKKKILNGNAGAIWSSSDDNLKAIINGSLTYNDSFGQKVSSEGNYRIEIKAEGGQAQVQKSNIIPISEFNYASASQYEININEGLSTLGADSGDGWTFQDGLLNIKQDGVYSIFGNGTATTNHVLIDAGVKATVFLKNVNIQTSGYAFNMQGAEVDIFLKGDNTLQCTGGVHGAGIQTSSSSRLVLSSADGDFHTSGILHAIGSTHGAGIGGSCDAVGNGDNDAGTIIIKGGTIEATGGISAAGIGGGNNGGSEPGTYTEITIEGGIVTATGGTGGAGIGTAGATSGGVNNGTINILGGTVTAKGGISGSYYAQGAGIGGGGGFGSGHIEINAGVSVTTEGYIESGAAASVGCGENGSPRDVQSVSRAISDPREIPSIPGESSKEEELLTLSEISTFVNSNGINIAQNPQKLTITQGNGKSADVMLYGEDTIKDVAKKINDAIANSLGQGNYVNDSGNFCTISNGKANTSESVYQKMPKYENGELTGYEVGATMLIRSAIPGKSGELHFSGDEELLNALGLNTIQNSEEATYTASVFDAHSGKSIITGVKATEPKFKNLIAPNVDVEITPTAGLISNWDENSRSFKISYDNSYSATLHLKDNSTILQIGANEGENFILNIADCSSEALGISEVNVLSHETASRAITVIDNAIDKISSQYAKIGAYENILSNTMENLSTANYNLVNSESRIRDADMAKLMMHFVKYQILKQSGTSMLAQANQLSNSVLNLIRS